MAVSENLYLLNQVTPLIREISSGSDFSPDYLLCTHYISKGPILLTEFTLY